MTHDSGAESERNTQSPAPVRDETRIDSSKTLLFDAKSSIEGSDLQTAEVQILDAWDSFRQAYEQNRVPGENKMEFAQTVEALLESLDEDARKRITALLSIEQSRNEAEMAVAKGGLQKLKTILSQEDWKDANNILQETWFAFIRAYNNAPPRHALAKFSAILQGLLTTHPDVAQDIGDIYKLWNNTRLKTPNGRDKALKMLLAMQKMALNGPALRNRDSQQTSENVRAGQLRNMKLGLPLAAMEQFAEIVRDEQEDPNAWWQEYSTLEKQLTKGT